MPEQINSDEVGHYYQPRLNLFVNTLVDKNAAVAEVSYRTFSADLTSADTFTETGSSKRDKGDPFDRNLGAQFAVARALVKLGKAIERDAAKQVARLTPAAPAVPAQDVPVPWWGWRA